MHHLFSPAGERALHQLMQRRALLAFDFDGTLAPIVARPDDALVPMGVARRLSELGRLRPIAVVTGRSVADVRPRLGFEPHYVVGNHGAEGLRWDGAGAGLDQLRARLRPQAEAMAALGVRLEDKGLSLALHYRLARDRLAAQALVDELLAELPPDLARFGGKCVVNVVMRAAPDKGDAVETLLHHSGCDAVLFVGDDVNDEAVFERGRGRPEWLSIYIGPEPGSSSAMFFLAAHAEMAGLLEKMQHALASQPP